MKLSERFWPFTWFAWWNCQVWLWAGVILAAFGNDYAGYIGVGMIIASLGALLAFTVVLFVLVKPEDSEVG